MVNVTCDVHKLLPTDQRRWYVFLAISIGVYVGGLIAILLGRLFIRFGSKKKGNRRRNYSEKGWYLSLINYAGNLQSGKNLPGKIIVAVSFLANMAAFIIYVVQSEHYPVEYCIDLKEDYNFFVAEMILYTFFVIHFVLRFITASNKLSFWVWDIYTYIDLLTFPLVFHIRTESSAWLGLRFLRIIYIRILPLVLNYLNVIKTGPTLEMGDIIGKFLALILSSAGMIHLLENTGDFWSEINYANNRVSSGKELNYFNCVYFMVVTLSTVGYGDISCDTYLGQIFSILIIIFGLGLFATYVPSIFEFLASHTKYDRPFSITPGKRHVVVTGHVTNKTFKGFVQDFLHPDRNNETTTVVFMNAEHPTLEMKSLLQFYYGKVLYFIGTVYKHEDCERMQMSEASSVIVLCNKKSENPEAEDAANITRVILLKKFYRDVPIIVQLIRKESKYQLSNCPQWKDNRDSVVCIDELKLGFMAQSCNAPGFSTLLANMFIMRTAEDAKGQVTDAWRQTYSHGVSCELYSTRMSNYFVGMPFPKVVQICYERLQLMLIAVEVDKNGKKIMAINPGEKVRLTENAIGFFCAQEYSDVVRAKHYDEINTDGGMEVKVYPASCLSGDSTSSEETLNSASALNSTTSFTKLNLSSSSCSPEHDSTVNFAFTSDVPETSNDNMLSVDIDRECILKKTKSVVDENDAMFDQTGTYFWCEKQNFLNSMMSLQEAESCKYVGHVVILVVSDCNAPSLGLRQLIQPLRASNQPAKELKKIIILGNKGFLAREWNSIANFPDVRIVEGSPYSRVDLRAINVHTADMCILLSPRQSHTSEGNEHEAMSDKEVIMVTLNLRAMTFEALDSLIQGTPMCSRSPRFERKIKSETKAMQKKIHSISGENITLITELVYDSNTLYMDDEVKSAICEHDIYMTQSYACGSVFTVSVLDFLASATYFNRDILKLVRNLVTGSTNPDLEKILMEGKEPNGTASNEFITAARDRCRVDQLNLDDPLFSSLGRINEFGELFLKSLQTHGILCLGLYRLHTTQTVSLKSLSTRYVITFPHRHMALEPTDLIFGLIPFGRSPNQNHYVES